MRKGGGKQDWKKGSSIATKHAGLHATLLGFVYMEETP